MWFIGVEVEQETSAPLPKKILDPPLMRQLSSATSSQNMLADAMSSPGLLDCCSFSLVTAYSIDVILPNIRNILQMLLVNSSWL